MTIKVKFGDLPPIQVAIAEEAEAADFVVCAYASVQTPFDDDVKTRWRHVRRAHPPPAERAEEAHEDLHPMRDRQHGGCSLMTEEDDGYLTLHGIVGDKGIVTGFKNAVWALRAYLRSMDLPLDEESFKRVGELRGDAPPETIIQGFIVRGYEDLQRLCEIADVVVYAAPENGGRITVCTPEEWKAGHG